MSSNQFHLPLYFNQLYDFVKQVPLEQKKKHIEVLQKDSSIEEIPHHHKSFVRDRIKNSKAKELLDWENIQDDFDGI